MSNQTTIFGNYTLRAKSVREMALFLRYLFLSNKTNYYTTNLELQNKNVNDSLTVTDIEKELSVSVTEGQFDVEGGDCLVYEASFEAVGRNHFDWNLAHLFDKIGAFRRDGILCNLDDGRPDTEISFLCELLLESVIEIDFTYTQYDFGNFLNKEVGEVTFVKGTSGSSTYVTEEFDQDSIDDLISCEVYDRFDVLNRDWLLSSDGCGQTHLHQLLEKHHPECLEFESLLEELLSPGSSYANYDECDLVYELQEFFDPSEIEEAFPELAACLF